MEVILKSIKVDDGEVTKHREDYRKMNQRCFAECIIVVRLVV